MPIRTVSPLLGLFVAGLLAALPAHAGGGREVITHRAEGTDIWQTEFDVRDLSPGTWNVIVNATDAAGNVGVSGPFNLRIDPMAGLPGTRVVYPAPGQILRGDVNVVGVTHAPFGVGQVYVRINDGDFLPVDGREFWHLNIPAGGLPDGRHSVFARVSDLDGLEGDVSRIDFVVDTAPPSIGLTSHEVGDLVSGRIRVRGTADDANGIRALFLSRDGENFVPLAHSGPRRGTARDFGFAVNTLNYEDGPLVYFVRAVDGTGASTVEPFLFFVNNVPPELEILSPGPDDDVFGLTRVTGRVVSRAGLDGFFFEWAGQREEIPLLPGDPFWTVSVPVDGRGGNLRVTAIDRAGNVARRSVNLRDRRPVRSPVIVIASPAPAGRVMRLEHDQPIYGYIAPGFLPYAIRLESGWLEAGGRYVMAQPSFRIDPDLIPMGQHTLVIRALDEDGLTGAPLSIRVNRMPPGEGVPEARMSPITVESPAFWGRGQGAHPWAGDNILIEGFVELDGGPMPSLEFRHRWDGLLWRRLALDDDGRFSATIPLGDMPEGPVALEMRTIRRGLPDIPVFLPVNRFVSGPVIRFVTPDARFGSIHGMVTTVGVVDSLVPIVDISYSVDGGNEFTSLDLVPGVGTTDFSVVVNYSRLHHDGLNFVVRATDRAGNEARASPAHDFDDSGDLPVLILNSPVPESLVTRDFEISGLAYDDDGIQAVYWRILRPAFPWETVGQILERASAGPGDDRFAGFNRVETDQNFLVPAGLDLVADGPNVLEVFAVDIFGTAGELNRTVFRVSLAPPETVVLEPSMETWNTGNVMVRGTSFDLNGVSEVSVSMDNGVSWQRADVESSQEEPGRWAINLNTRAFADGTYAMLVRAVDGLGVLSYSSGIINIDNSAPEVDVALPREGASFSTEIFVSGQVYDNMALRGISIRILKVDDPGVRETRELGPGFVVMERFDVSGFPDGDYVVQVSARDYSGNETIVVRNVSLVRGNVASEVAIINPLPGITHSGPVIVSGRVSGAVVPDSVALSMNGRHAAMVEVDRFGLFRHEVPGDVFGNSPYYAFRASFVGPDGQTIESVEHAVVVNEYGPVLTIDSHADGDAVTGRPWFSGRAFVLHPEPDGPVSRQERAALRPESVSVSFDNGRSFVPASGRENWRIRIETDEFPDGLLPVVVRAVFGDGAEAVRRVLLSVDTAAPIVATIGPAENTLHRHDVMVFGSAADNSALDGVEISLRRGSKHLYAVPGFVEGLYLEAGVLGGLLWTSGIGLSFFDDNVKLQFNVSQAPPGRFQGMAFGGKVLANIWTANLRRWFGNDWEWWTTGVAIGAHFSYFMMGAGENPQWMGQFLGQWEFIKADMSHFVPSWRFFRSISLYVEPGVWFAPSDVDNDPLGAAWRYLFTVGFGIRFSLF